MSQTGSQEVDFNTTPADGTRAKKKGMSTCSDVPSGPPVTTKETEVFKVPPIPTSIKIKSNVKTVAERKNALLSMWVTNTNTVRNAANNSTLEVPGEKIFNSHDKINLPLNTTNNDATSDDGGQCSKQKFSH